MYFAGHVLRMSEQRLPKTTINWIPSYGWRKRGRSKQTWHQTFQKDLKNINLKWKVAETVAVDQKLWSMLVAQCAQHRI